MSRFASAALLALAVTAPAWAEPIAASDPRLMGWATGATVIRGPQQLGKAGSPDASFGGTANATGARDGNVLSLGDGGQATLTFAAPIINRAGADFVVFENGFIIPAGRVDSGLVFGELGFVEVSSNGVDFVRFPSQSLTPTAAQLTNNAPGPSGVDPAHITGLAGQYANNSLSGIYQGTGFDLSDLPTHPALDIHHITHVRIIDIVGDLANPTLDSFGNPINDPWTTDTASGGFDLDAVGVINQAPEPSSMLLLLAGSGVVGLYRLRKRRFAPTAVALLLALVVAGGVQADTAEKEFPKLHGTWVVVSAEKDGQDFAIIKGGKLTIKDQNFAIVTKGGTEMKGDLVLTPGKKPKHIDFTHQEGLLRDKTWQGIYELDGDELKLCYAEADSNKERPTEFKTAQDSGLLLIVMKRKKD